MRPAYILFFSSFSLFILPAFIASADAPSVIISEVQIGGKSVDDEFIELYNAGKIDTDLKPLKLIRSYIGEDKTVKEVDLKSFSRASFILKSGQYYLWANSKGKYSGIADTTTGGGLTKNDIIRLITNDGSKLEIDSVSWGADARTSESIVRIHHYARMGISPISRLPTNRPRRNYPGRLATGSISTGPDTGSRRPPHHHPSG